jgi:Resolvase, N terminal domain
VRVLVSSTARKTTSRRSLTMTPVCLYTRISTDEENQPTSLASQHERLEAFCKVQEDWRIIAHHQDRATGTKLNRPGLQAALDLARQPAILIAELRVNSHNEILPTYRVGAPVVCAQTSPVGVAGIELLATKSECPVCRIRRRTSEPEH